MLSTSLYLHNVCAYFCIFLIICTDLFRITNTILSVFVCLFFLFFNAKALEKTKNILVHLQIVYDFVCFSLLGLKSQIYTQEVDLLRLIEYLCE